MDPEKRVTKAVEQAQSILARYVEPGPRDCENTISELMDVLDDEAVVEAVEETKMESRHPSNSRSSSG
ncbi:hypothetical protein NLM27_41295 [Bradyrhizobium sp. CCGB12]|uniref:hypothetical protein n=1 Tax=Bradyrhizobium sp. CCGB12 TaxID=2949632 RepID=UPI0020B45B6A|nr:hypothetical protein [Bradyrhizobium sp. CCGB12]MCP3395182.1 hypothetical protein [Bradyrhizobium sp. CCGB12]